MSVASDPPSRRAAPGVTPAAAAARLGPLWRELLRLDQVGLDDDFFDLGGDSALAVELFARIEREFGRKLPLATLFDAPTVGRLAEVLAQGSTAACPCLVPIQPAGRSRPLFLIHDGTGEVLGYRTLARRLGVERPVYGFQWAGPAAGEAGALTVEALATRYVQELSHAQPQGPYYLGGYCGGGTVAYEMAQQLTARGEHVALLALIDAFNWARLPPPSRRERWRFDAERLEFLVRNYFYLPAEARRHLRCDKAAELAARLKHMRTRGLRQVWRADSAPMAAALRAYQAQPYPGRVLDIRPRVQHRRMRGEGAKWGQLALGGVDVIVLPAHAGGLLPEPLVQHLAEALRKSLTAADAATDPGPVLVAGRPAGVTAAGRDTAS